MRTTRKPVGWLLPAFVSILAAWPLASLAQPAAVDPAAIKELRRAT